MATFTDKSLRELQPRAVAFRVFEKGRDAGFGVRVSPGGVRQFFLQYAHNGRRRFLALGTYPTTSIAEARHRARAARATLEAGNDPQAKVDAGTCSDLFRVYVARLDAAGKRSAGKVRRTLENQAAPTIGHRPAASITSADVRDVLAPLVRRGARIGANRLRSYLSAAFRAGIHHDNDPAGYGGVRFGLMRNPVDDVPRDTSAEKAGNRELSWPEIRHAWIADGLSEPYAYALRWMLATGGQRPGEVLGAAFSDIVGDVWHIPPERTKNGRAHLVPLHPLALHLVDELRAIHGQRCLWLFPAHWRARAKVPMVSTSLAHAVADWLASGATGDAPPMVSWTPRDLRRTVKTRLGELGISKDSRDRLQNHARRDVSSLHYDRYDYLAEKRAAVFAFCERLAAELAMAPAPTPPTP